MNLCALQKSERLLTSKVRVQLQYYSHISPLQTDLGRRKVDESEGRLWAETKGFHYFETSAQSNTNIQEMFETLVKSVVGVINCKDHSGGRIKLELGYSSEQAALVTRIRSCSDNYDILNVSRTCSRLVCVF